MLQKQGFFSTLFLYRTQVSYIRFNHIVILGIMTMLALWKALPQDHDVVKPNVAKGLRVLTRAPVVLALLTTVMSAAQCLRYIPTLLRAYTYLCRHHRKPLP